jgi:hypothetical protein
VNIGILAAFNELFHPEWLAVPDVKGLYLLRALREKGYRF